jgi:DNA-binding response OmpR family regulator
MSRCALVVDDDDFMAEILAAGLANEGFGTVRAGSVAAARVELQRGGTSLVVLDLGLPDGAGLDLLREIRSTSDVPVLVVSGRKDLETRVQGLRLGADDYLTKPFSLAELGARAAAILRRSGTPAHRRLAFEDCVLDLGSRELVRGGVPIALAGRELELLEYLVVHADRVCTRDELLAEVWRSSPDDTVAATVTEHVRRLRLKLDPSSHGRSFIKTVRRHGYRFDATVRPLTDPPDAGPRTAR